MTTKLLPFCLSLLLVACGGGGGGGGGAGPAPAPAFAPGGATAYSAGSAESGGWTTLQQARLSCGFGALKKNPQLDAAALAHAKYLTYLSVTGPSSVLSHYETDTTNPYYSGYYPWDRTTRQGYGDQVAEILESTSWSYSSSNPPPIPTLEQRGSASMLDLLTTVYHLIGAMYDGADVGFGASLQTVTSGTSVREEYAFGSLNGYQTQVIRLGAGNLATYPCQGSNNIPPRFFPANESPNPFPAITSPLQAVGPPIYLKVDAGQVLILNASSISAGGISVPTTLLNQANDPARDQNGNPEIHSNEAFIVPVNALAPNTLYQVDLTGTINGTAFSRSFVMSTGA